MPRNEILSWFSCVTTLNYLKTVENFATDNISKYKCLAMLLIEYTDNSSL